MALQGHAMKGEWMPRRRTETGAAASAEGCQGAGCAAGLLQALRPEVALESAHILSPGAGISSLGGARGP